MKMLMPCPDWVQHRDRNAVGCFTHLILFITKVCCGLCLLNPRIPEVNWQCLKWRFKIWCFLRTWSAWHWPIQVPTLGQPANIPVPESGVSYDHVQCVTYDMHVKEITPFPSFRRSIDIPPSCTLHVVIFKRYYIKLDHIATFPKFVYRGLLCNLINSLPFDAY